MMKNDNVFAFIKEKDLHTYFINMIQPGKDLDKGINCTDKKDNEEFKRGAIWGIAWFLISVCANCEKVYLREKPDLTEFEEAIDKIIQNCSKDGKFDTEKFGSIFNQFFENTLEKEDEKE